MSIASKRWFHLLIILLAGTVLCLPCIFYGIPNGYNARTHVNYQHHFSQQFWNGDVYPRWLTLANKGYGSPIFLMQYPLPYFATALLRPFTSFPPAVREARELGLFAWLALAAAGITAWLWLRQLANSRGAILGALFYMSLPYILGQALYVRVAIGELAAFVWMPLAFCLCDWMFRKTWAALALSVVVALLILSNFLDAVLFAPALAAYGIVAGRRWNRSWLRSGVLVCAAELVGGALAGAYLGPALAYRQLFDLHQLGVHLPGYRLGFYFMGISANSLEERIVALAVWGAALSIAAGAWYCWRVKANGRVRIGMAVLLALGALALIPDFGAMIVRFSGYDLASSPYASYSAKLTLCLLFTFVFGSVAYCTRAEDPSDRRPLLLLSIAGVAFLFMLPFSAPVWKAIPAASAIQFPFRLGGIQSVAVAGLGALAFDKSRVRGAASGWRKHVATIEAAALIVSLVGVCVWRLDRAFRHPATANFAVAQDIDSMYRTYVPPERVMAFADNLGTRPESYDVEARPGDGAFRFNLISGDCTVEITPERARQLTVVSDCKAGGLLRIGQMHFPLWRIVSSKGPAPQSKPVISTDGLNEVKLAPGRQDFQLLFDGGIPERWGAIVSGISLLWLIGVAISRTVEIKARS